jgi:PAS domain S-box-containing protein
MIKNEQPVTNPLFETLLIPTWVYDPATLRFLAVNKAACECYGYSHAEFMQMTLADIRLPEDAGVMQQNIDNTVKPYITSPRQERWRHRRKNGDVFYVQLFANYIEHEGQPARMVQAVDIDLKIKEANQLEEINAVLNNERDEIDFVLSTINENVWIADAQTFKLIYTNAACEKIHGYTAAEMMGDGSLFFQSLHPDDKAAFFESAKRMMENGWDDREFRIIHKDGSIRHLKGVAWLRKGVDGRRDVCCGVTSDITELKLAEKAITKQQKDIETILESITDGFFALDGNWNFVYVNNAFEKLFDKPRTELLGRNYWEEFPHSTQKKFYSEYNRARDEKQSVHFEEYAASLGKWVSVGAYPNRNGLSVYFTDITEQKQLKDALVHHEKNLHALINNTEDLIWSVDTNYRLLTANAAYLKQIKEFTGDDLQIGDDITQTNTHEQYKQMWKAYLDRAFAGERFKTVDEYNIGGQSIYCEISFNPIIDDEGTVIGVSCYSADITDRLNHLLQIELQNRQLKEIAHIQSHQVRGPVATIMGLRELLNTNDPCDPTNGDIIKGIHETAELLDTMIRDIDKRTQAVWAEV